jgi:hypothetical protein
VLIFKINPLLLAFFCLPYNYADRRCELAGDGWLHTIRIYSSMQPWLAFLALCHLPTGME